MMGKRKPISLSLDFQKSKKARRKQPVLGLDGAEVSKTENEKDFVSAISDNTLDGSAKEAQLPVIAVPLNPWQKKKEDNAVNIDNEKKKKKFGRHCGRGADQGGHCRKGRQTRGLSFPKLDFNHQPP
mmetsp:Transcript_15322/g.20559  ORF Transcript_15322/g.20559 Transcript_15322/m.20559 type:complete len:127 (-) Transcript_15322:1213-1593(-)